MEWGAVCGELCARDAVEWGAVCLCAAGGGMEWAGLCAAGAAHADA